MSENDENSVLQISSMDNRPLKINTIKSNMSSRIPEKVVKLSRKIEARDPVDFSFIKEAVAGAGISANEFENHSSFSHPPDQSYGRILLHESRRLKIFLMCWTPGDFTAIHDHGSTDWGGVVALGDFTHRVYRFEDGLLRLRSNSPFGEGQVACLTGDLIHMMGNTGNKNIMSLHIYGSDSGNGSLAKKSRVYLPESRKVITTNGPAFLNCPREAIIREEAFSAICKHALDDYLDLLKLRLKISTRTGNRQQDAGQRNTGQTSIGQHKNGSSNSRHLNKV